MITRKDMNGAIMQGETMFEEWKMDFEEMWLQPEKEDMLKVVLAAMSPEQLASIPTDELNTVLDMGNGFGDVGGI